MPYTGPPPQAAADVGDHEHDFRVDPDGAMQLLVHQEDRREEQSQRMICVNCGAEALAPYEGLDSVRRDPDDIRDWATLEEAHEELSG